MEANSQVNTAVIDDLRGIETLKSLRVEERRYQEIEVKFHDYLKKSLSKAKWQLTQDGLKDRGSVSFQCLYPLVWGTIGHGRATICRSVDYL